MPITDALISTELISTELISTELISAALITAALIGTALITAVLITAVLITAAIDHHQRAQTPFQVPLQQRGHQARRLPTRGVLRVLGNRPVPARQRGHQNQGRRCRTHRADRSGPATVRTEQTA